MLDLKDHTLYFYPSCPFCIRVLNKLEELRIQVTLKNIRQDEKYRRELIEGGGKAQVPCMEMGGKWLYESKDIIEYLQACVTNK